MAEHKKLRREDRTFVLSWTKIEGGFNERHRQVWMHIYDDLGFEYEIRMTKRQARWLAGKLLDAADDLESCRDQKV